MMDVSNTKSDMGISVTSMLVLRAVEKNQELKELREKPVPEPSVADKVKADKTDTSDSEKKVQADSSVERVAVVKESGDVQSHVDVLV